MTQHEGAFLETLLLEAPNDSDVGLTRVKPETRPQAVPSQTLPSCPLEEINCADTLISVLPASGTMNPKPWFKLPSVGLTVMAALTN